MIRELELHRKAPKTIEAYVSAVADLASTSAVHPMRLPSRKFVTFFTI